MKVEGGERLVLKDLLDLQGDSGENVEDFRVAAVTKMGVQDVRDWLETLEGKGFVERTRLTDGFSAYVTAKGKQALRLTEPISTPKPAGDGAPVTSEPSGGTGAPSPPIATAGAGYENRESSVSGPTQHHPVSPGRVLISILIDERTDSSTGTNAP